MRRSARCRSARGDTVVVSGAAGGRRRSLAVQLARIAGARVLRPREREAPRRGSRAATSSPWSTARGPPIASAPRREGALDAFVDTFGSGYVRMALDLGVQPRARRHHHRFRRRPGVRRQVRRQRAPRRRAEVLGELAALVARGQARRSPSRRSTRCRRCRPRTAIWRSATPSARSCSCPELVSAECLRPRGMAREHRRHASLRPRLQPRRLPPRAVHRVLVVGGARPGARVVVGSASLRRPRMPRS